MASGLATIPLSTDHEYVLAYARSAEAVGLRGVAPKEADYPHDDGRGRYRSSDLTIGMDRTMRPGQYYAIANPRTGAEYLPPEERVWRFQPSTMEQQIDVGNVIWPDDEPEKRMSRPRFKTRYEAVLSQEQAIPVSSWIAGSAASAEEHEMTAGLNQEGTKELRALLGSQTLDYPKPVSLLRLLTDIASADGDLIMDFFAGSGTTAQAVMEANGADDGSRRYVLVQLPEEVAEKSAAGTAGFTSVSAIARERIRRAATAASDSSGFRAFRLTTSNYRPWSGVDGDDAGTFADTMALFSDPLVAGWRAEDVIWEVALKEGYALTCRIERAASAGENTVFRVTDDDLGQSFHICLDETVAGDLVKALGLTRDDLFVCRDVALTDDTAANFALQCRLKTI